jgi:hypothetical protein
MELAKILTRPVLNLNGLQAGHRLLELQLKGFVVDLGVKLGRVQSLVPQQPAQETDWHALID